MKSDEQNIIYVFDTSLLMFWRWLIFRNFGKYKYCLIDNQKVQYFLDWKDII